MLEQLNQTVWEANIALPKKRLITSTSGNVSGRDKKLNSLL